jgi:drug/metabolite transporter (DMT)-like permease
MNYGLIFALLAPLIWACMNILDKFVLSHRIKNYRSFTVLAGLANFVYGLMIALVIDWNDFQWSSIIFPIIVGFFLGLQFYLYFALMSKSDASYFVGFTFLYPPIVALLSFIFLRERFGIPVYIGSALILIGVILLALRAQKIRSSFAFLLIVPFIFITAGYEFFIKVATIQLNLYQSMAVSSMVIGVVISFLLTKSKVRKSLSREIKNIGWAFFNEGLTTLGLFSTYLAMNLLPATVVSSISSIQPLIVIGLEAIFDKHIATISSDKRIIPKLIAVVLIVLGVALISSSVN